jgi:hypothetical protein
VQAHIGGRIELMPTLGVEICEVSKGPPVEKIVFDIIDHPFDFAFGARSADAMGFGNDAVMIHKIQKQRIPLLLR